jgi:hypothetical protein
VILSSHSLENLFVNRTQALAHLSSPTIFLVIRECLSIWRSPFGGSFNVRMKFWKIPSLMTKKRQQYVCRVDHIPVVQVDRQVTRRSCHRQVGVGKYMPNPPIFSKKNTDPGWFLGYQHGVGRIAGCIFFLTPSTCP